jgi:hypothetical protein
MAVHCGALALQLLFLALTGQLAAGWCACKVIMAEHFGVLALLAVVRVVHIV